MYKVWSLPKKLQTGYTCLEKILTAWTAFVAESVKKPALKMQFQIFNANVAFFVNFADSHPQKKRADQKLFSCCKLIGQLRSYYFSI